jgi:hypothetical protein
MHHHQKIVKVVLFIIFYPSLALERTKLRQYASWLNDSRPGCSSSSPTRRPSRRKRALHLPYPRPCLSPSPTVQRGFLALTREDLAYATGEG